MLYRCKVLGVSSPVKRENLWQWGNNRSISVISSLPIPLFWKSGCTINLPIWHTLFSSIRPLTEPTICSSSDTYFRIMPVWYSSQISSWFCNKGGRSNLFIRSATTIKDFFCKDKMFTKSFSSACMILVWLIILQIYTFLKTNRSIASTF